MRVAIIVVGKPTQHWQGLFEALARKPDLELVVQAADVGQAAEMHLGRLAARQPSFEFRLARHLLQGEDLTGHMASVVFRPGALRRLRDFTPDVVHVIGEPAYLATFQAIRTRNRYWPGVPITQYAAQNVVTRFPWPFPLLERYAYRQISLALPITPAALMVLRAKGYRGPAEVVPLGVDRVAFAPRVAPPPGPFTIGFVGRFEEHKGIVDLVAACEQLDCRLLLVGSGSLGPWLAMQAALRPGTIELVPWVDRDVLPELMARMHALALPSVDIVRRNVAPWMRVPLREQFGRVLVEAMSCGLPVVASHVGEIPHVVGSSGVLVPPRDPAALRDALAGIRDHPERARELARLGVSRAARFDWERIADQLVAAWSRGVTRRSHPSARCKLCGAVVASEQPARWVKDGFDIVSCPCCGLLFRRELPGPSEVKKIYAGHYFKRPSGERGGQGYADYLGDEQIRRVDARRRLVLLSQHVASGRLLDVGCASGFFLDEARSIGWAVSGVDVAPTMTAPARDRFGLEVETVSFQAADFPRAGLDCVTMWDYLEHSSDPVADVCKALTLLRPGGVLALSTGDAAARIARISGCRWHLLTPQHHNFFFTRRLLTRMLSDTGFELVGTSYEPRHATLRSLVGKLRTLAPRSRVVRAAGEWLGDRQIGDVSVRVNMFDVVTLFARRPLTASPQASGQPSPVPQRRTARNQLQSRHHREEVSNARAV